MKKTSFIISMILTGVILCAQVLTVFAAPDAGTTSLISGAVTYVEIVADESTGAMTVVVTVQDDMGASQTIHISLETAVSLTPPLIYNDGEGYVIVQPLPGFIEINAADVISDEPHHPVGNALATFFSDIDGLTYETIMQAHDQNGFGVIAQALWMTRKLAEENSELLAGDGSLTESQIFLAILDMKKGGDYSSFFPEDESAPANWGQFKKAILDGDKKANLGAVMSHREENAANNAQPDHGNGNGNGNQDKKDKPDHPNNGNGRGPR